MTATESATPAWDSDEPIVAFEALREMLTEKRGSGVRPCVAFLVGRNLIEPAEAERILGGDLAMARQTTEAARSRYVEREVSDYLARHPEAADV